MADRKISELTQITGANVDDANDELAIVDASASQTKAITRSELFSSVSSMSLSGDLTVDTDTLYVDSANNRVGIGTSSPSELLHLTSGTTSTILLDNSDTVLTEGQLTGAIEFYQRDLTNGGTGTSGKIAMRSAARPDTGTYFGNASDMAFYVSGSGDGVASDNASLEALTIRASGNVGIGTSSPVHDLDVIGQINASSRIRVGGAAAIYAPNSSELQIGSASAGDFLTFYTDLGEAMRIDSSGKVGIGTSSPARELSIGNGTGSPNIQFLSSNVGNSRIEFGDTDDSDVGEIQYLHSSNNMVISTNNSEAMRIDSGGNVGIGTSSPSRTLDVSGNAQIGGSGINYPLKVTSTDGISGVQFEDGATVTAPTVEATGNNLAFQTGGSEAMRIDSSGNVLVGTTTLNISTSSSATGFVVNNDGFLEMGRAGPVLVCNRVTGTGENVIFRQAGNTVGDISVTTSTTSYNTSSDERLKENIADAQTASDLIDGIQVREFDWKADGEHQRYGMVAQELETVAPEAVTKGETEDDMWSVDYSKLVPMLVKEIQDLRKRVADLET